MYSNDILCQVLRTEDCHHSRQKMARKIRRLMRGERQARSVSRYPDYLTRTLTRKTHGSRVGRMPGATAPKRVTGAQGGARK